MEIQARTNASQTTRDPQKWRVQSDIGRLGRITVGIDWHVRITGKVASLIRSTIPFPLSFRSFSSFHRPVLFLPQSSLQLSSVSPSFYMNVADRSTERSFFFQVISLPSDTAVIVLLHVCTCLREALFRFA